MRNLNNLEFEINHRIKELIGKHGLMSTHNPMVGRLFHNLARIQKLKQITEKRQLHKVGAESHGSKQG